MKVAIVQFDNRPLPSLGLLPALLHRNQAYAARCGYGYHFVDRNYFDLPPYWQKPKIVRQYLVTGYDAVVWLDTDAVVHDLDRRVEDLFEGAEIMVAARDNPYWDTPFNAGVFLVRGAEGADLMARWADLFPADAWRRTETAWTCDDTWAGPAFEQGAFAQRLLPELAQSGALRLADWRTLQSPFPMPGTFTVHFAGPFRANLPAYLSLL